MCQLCDMGKNVSADQKSKRHFLKTVSVLGVAALSAKRVFAGGQSAPPNPNNVMSPEEALDRLMEGNQRYINGASTPFDFMRDRQALVAGQNPYASIVSCADSRVAPEFCFDEQRGDLFVTRGAGNYVSADVLASLEFAALVLNVPLIMVLGHQHCGAVDAAIAAVEKHQQFPGHIQTITTAIAPAVRATQKQQGDRTANVTRKNVLLNVERLQQAAPAISRLVAEKAVKVVGAVYSLESGKVELLT